MKKHRRTRAGLENYAYSLKNTLKDEKVISKIDAADKVATM